MVHHRLKSRRKFAGIGIAYPHADPRNALLRLGKTPGRIAHPYLFAVLAGTFAIGLPETFPDPGNADTFRFCQTFQ